MKTLKLNHRIIFYGGIGFFISFFVYYPVSVLVNKLLLNIPLLPHYFFLTSFSFKYLPMAFYFSFLGLICGIIHAHYIHGVIIRSKQNNLEIEDYSVQCSHCKKIKIVGDKKNDIHWIDFEQSIVETYEKKISHGICPRCAAALYPDLIDEVLSS